MKSAPGHYLAAALLLLGFTLGCGLPPSAEQHPLSAAAARQTLDQWNPSYCKVLEFYGFNKPGTADGLVAYVLLANPGEQSQKPTVYEAWFKLLTRPNGREQWFLTSLMSHAAGLSRRQGWDNLFIPVQEEAPAPKGK